MLVKNSELHTYNRNLKVICISLQNIFWTPMFKSKGGLSILSKGDLKINLNFGQSKNLKSIFPLTAKEKYQ